MSEPTTLYSGLKALAVGSASGLTYAAAIVQANPEMAAAVTPSLEKSIYLLALGIILAAGKSYLPSEKKVDLQFQSTHAGVEDLKTGHKTLTEKLEALIDGTEEERKDRRNHYNMLYRWMGETDQKFVAMNDKFDDVRGRLTRIERVTGEVKRPQ